jgi:hypothetical protein
MVRNAVRSSSNTHHFSLEQERTRIIELLEMALINGAVFYAFIMAPPTPLALILTY